MYHNLANLYRDNHQYDSAMIAFEQSMAIREKNNQQVKLGISYSNYASLLAHVGDNGQALTYYKKAITLFREQGKLSELSNAFTNLGNSLRLEHRLDSAKDVLKRAIALKKNGGFVPTLPSTYLHMGNVYLEEREYDSAKACYDSALIHLEGLYKPRVLAMTYNAMGVYWWRQNELDSAMLWVKKGYEAFQESSSPIIRHELLFNLVCLSQDNNDLASAQKYTQELQEALKELEKRKISFYKMRHELAVSKLRLEAANATISAQKVQRYNNQLIFGLVIALLLLVVGALLFSLYYNKEKRKKAEEAARRIKAEAEKVEADNKIDQLIQEQATKFQQGLVEGSDIERERLAKDLHDRIGALLVSVQIQFKALESSKQLFSEAQAKQYETAVTILDDCIDQLRTIAHDLDSPVLKRYGLVAALADFLENLKGVSPVAFKFIYRIKELRLPLKIERHLFNITCGLISNILKHSGAEEASVQILQIEEDIVLTVEDDGVGFKVNTKDRQTGMGLQNIQERAASIDGIAEFDSAPGNGTTVTVKVPYRKLPKL